MKPILITGDRWTPIARRERRQRCVIQTDKTILIKYSQEGAREQLLLPGKHLVSFIYTLYAKPPEHDDFDYVAFVSVYYQNLSAILGEA